MMFLKQLSRYTIEAHLGAGAFADVYLAVDGVLGRRVALKVLKPRLVSDQDAFVRFTREARVAATLFHPNIATVLDMGEADGSYFIAMRYVGGQSLDQIIAQVGRLSWPAALEIAGQIGGALEFAHARGLVHRDVKPQNILVGEADGAVLTDFGLVKALHSVSLTSSAALLGTPAYIAPEIWEGKEASPVSDQYALACVLAEMLTGKALFGGNTPPAVMAKHFRSPEWPAWPEGVPAGIARVLGKALARQPEERYASIAEFLVALRTPAQGPGISINPQSPISNLKSDTPAGIEWVEVPAGEFLYGEKKEKFYLRKAFLIGKYPVTNEQYQCFIDANPKYPVPYMEQDWARPYNWDNQTRRHPPGQARHPVVLVSWNDAQEFCKWAGCRLPTEQEWEKAARSTDGRTYPWGNDWVAGKYCNSAEAKLGGTTPVDEFPEGVSPCGAWDMGGNVWEWTDSLYESGKYVLRGGSWLNSGYNVRSAFRNRDTPEGVYSYIGFRCSRSP